MFDTLVWYLEECDIRLERYMFCAVLKSLKLREEGHFARSANSCAYITELVEHVGDGTVEHPDIKKAKKELAKYSRDVWELYIDNKSVE